jgi:hypothetical protein
MQMNDEQEKLLEACSNADKVTYVSKDLANSALNHTHLHISSSLGKKLCLNQCKKFLRGSSVHTTC